MKAFIDSPHYAALCAFVDNERAVGKIVYPTDVFRALRRASDRAGAILATGDTRTEALAAAERAASRIRFVTKKVEAA